MQACCCRIQLLVRVEHAKLQDLDTTRTYHVVHSVSAGLQGGLPKVKF